MSWSRISPFLWVTALFKELLFKLVVILLTVLEWSLGHYNAEWAAAHVIIAKGTPVTIPTSPVSVQECSPGELSSEILVKTDVGGNET